MDRNSAIEKIKKCLALSKSANEHEAATAIRQARALMEKFKVSDFEMMTAEIYESTTKAGAKKKPTLWESALAGATSRAFGCELTFVMGYRESRWKFIGSGPAPEIAQYAFTVLMRQIKKERTAFIQSKCKRLIPASRTRRADLFCEAWVISVSELIRQFAAVPVDNTALDAYMGKHYGNCQDIKPRNRNDGHKFKNPDIDAYEAGKKAGRNAQLNHGVAASGEPQLSLGDWS
jgi:hypothetical protein